MPNSVNKFCLNIVFCFSFALSLFCYITSGHVSSTDMHGCHNQTIHIGLPRLKFISRLPRLTGPIFFWSSFRTASPFASDRDMKIMPLFLRSSIKVSIWVLFALALLSTRLVVCVTLSQVVTVLSPVLFLRHDPSWPSNDLSYRNKTVLLVLSGPDHVTTSANMKRVLTAHKTAGRCCLNQKLLDFPRPVFLFTSFSHRL